MHPLNPAELGYLHCFFSSVGAALASRMHSGSTPSEDNLTFLLCELLDEGFTSRHVLSYSLQDLNQDLDACAGGNRVEISFQTNEHTRRYESSTSFSDLGIVFERRDISRNLLRKALLIQSKRLFHNRAGFTLASRYQSFDSDQLSNLLKLMEYFSEYNGAYYFLYNPDLDGIAEPDRPRVAAFESSHPGYSGKGLHFLMREFGLHPYAHHLLGLAPPTKEALDTYRSEQQRLLAQRPGLRVSGLHTIKDLASKHSLSLADFYRYRDEHPCPDFGCCCRFETFEDFMVFGLLACNAGSQSDGILAVASGKQLAKEHLKENKGPLPEGVGARHTLTIKITSVLAEQG